MKITFLKHALLPATVAITGGCVLVVEVVAVRILAPFFGSTIYTVSSIISVILLALSCGYAIGGRLADKHPNTDWMFRIIFLGGLSVLFCYGVGSLTLPFLSRTFSLSTGALIASLGLFFTPAFLLGMLSPYAVVLQSRLFENHNIGSASGTIFFWSTLGSIVGSLSTGFFLIPYVGVQSIMLGCGAVLCVLGILPTFMKERWLRAGLMVGTAGLVIVFAWGTSSAFAFESLYAEDGVYEYTRIYDGEYEGRPARFLQQEFNIGAARFLDSDDPLDLPFPYTQYYRLYTLFVDDPKQVLAIGGGAYSVPQAIAVQEKNAQVDVVEIEPKLYPLMQEYFGLLDLPNLHNIVDDGRRFLSTTDTTYDVIFSDVYHSQFSIPAHFTTKEFFEIAESHLTENGVFIANVLGKIAPDNESFLFSEMRTFQTVFPHVAFIAVDDVHDTDFQNIIFVGWKSDVLLDAGNELISSSTDPRIQSLPDHRIDISTLGLEKHPIFTDNYAPVEYLMAKDLAQQ